MSDGAEKALTRFEEGGWQWAIRKEKMNNINTGATRRHTLPLRKIPAGNTPSARRRTFNAMLSTIELRRLVAAMVD